MRKWVDIGTYRLSPLIKDYTCDYESTMSISLATFSINRFEIEKIEKSLYIYIIEIT